MMGSLSRKALMQGAMFNPTTPCFFRAVRQVANTWLDAMNSVEQFTTRTSYNRNKSIIKIKTILVFFNNIYF